MIETIKCLDNAKVGDKFMRSINIGWKTNAGYGVVWCERVTPKQVIVGGKAYWKKNGALVGDGYERLYEVDDKALEATRIAIIRHKLPHLKWDALSDEEILAIHAIVKGRAS